MTLALLALLLAGAGDAAAAPVAASGYVKNLYDYTRGLSDGAPHWLDLTRARLTLDGAVPEGDGPRLAAHLDYDHELRTGSYLQSRDYRALGLREPPGYFDMEQAISTGGSYSYRHRLYRAWAGAEGDDWTLRFGRQRVAWGTGKIWNPTDVLNPFEPSSIERDERRGTDAVYARRGVGELGQAEAAWAIGGRWPDTDLLGRVRGHAGTADAALMGGKIAGSSSSWMLGGDFSSNLGEGNLHGEWSYSAPGAGRSFFKGLVGFETTLSPGSAWAPLRELWVLAEYFHNGAGAASPARYDFSRLGSGREVAVGRDYLGLGLSKDLHPLLKAEAHQVLNLNDRSHLLNASVAWNVLVDTYLTAGLERFGGSRRTEYGRLPNIAYLQAQYFF